MKVRHCLQVGNNQEKNIPSKEVNSRLLEEYELWRINASKKSSKWFMGIWFAFEKCSELESHLLPESSYLKSLSLKKKKNCIPTGTAYSELAEGLFPIPWRNLFLWLVCWSGFCLFLVLFLRKGVSVAALELTRLPGLELGNDLLVSASWVPGLKMWHVMLSDLNFHVWEMRVWFPISWKNPVLLVIS